MGDKPNVSPRINLAQSQAHPVAGKVEVKFNPTRPGKVFVGDHADINVDPGTARVVFELNARDMPHGASASIVGIEFPAGDSPANQIPPDEVFENKHTIVDEDGHSHTVYGLWKEDHHRLKIVDDNWPEGEQLYGYRVWVEMIDGPRKRYFHSSDPTIRNKPQT